MSAFKIKVTVPTEHEEEPAYILETMGAVSVESVQKLVFEECFPRNLYFGHDDFTLVLDQNIRVNFRDLPKDFQFNNAYVYDIEYFYKGYTMPFAMRWSLGTLFFATMYQLTSYAHDYILHTEEADESSVVVMNLVQIMSNMLWVVLGFRITTL